MLASFAFALMALAAQDSVPVVTPSRLDLHCSADLALQAGDGEAARSLWLQALALDPEQPTLAYGLACAAMLEGQPEEALAWLERAVSWGYGDAALAAWDQDLAELHTEPRFRNLLTRMRSSTVPNGAFVSNAEPCAWILPKDAGQRLGAGVLSPYGEFIALPLVRRGQVRLIDGLTGEDHWLAELDQGQPLALAFTPDTQQLFGLDSSWALSRWDVNTGELVRRHTVEADMKSDFDERLVTRLAFLSEGQRVVGRIGEHTLLLDSKGQLIAHALGDRREGRLAFHATSPHIVFVFRSSLNVMDVRSGEVSEILNEIEGPIHGIGLSPGGGLLAIGHGPGFVSLIETKDWSVRWRRRTYDDWADLDPINVPVLLFAEDSSRLVYSTVSGHFVVARSIEDGKTLWRSEYLGGRMGGAMPLCMSGNRVIADKGKYAFGLEQGERLPTPAAGAWLGALHVGRDGALLSTVRTGRVTRFDLEEGTQVFQRIEFSSGEYALLDPSGYFAGSVRDLDLIQKSGRPLHAFDPKRLRAAAAGVVLRKAAQ